MIEFTLYSIIAFIITIGILVSFHEYGHFLVARLCGVTVEQFSIGFGPALWRRRSKKSNTEYRIGVIPLGGYVKMLDERDGPIKKDQQSFAFNRQAVWKRALIVLAGPVFNFILAFIAYWLIFIVGFKQVIPQIGSVEPASIAAQAGLQVGQQFIQIDENNVYSWDDVQTRLLTHIGASNPVKITVEQNNQATTLWLNLSQWRLEGRRPDVFSSLGIEPYIPATPAVINEISANSPAQQAGLLVGDEIKQVGKQSIHDWQTLLTFIQSHPGEKIVFTVLRQNKLQQVPVLIGIKYDDERAYGYLGIVSAPYPWPDTMLHAVRYSAWAALPKAATKTWQMTQLSVELVAKMLTGQISWQGLSGPIGIAQGAGYSASLGVLSFLGFLALISISLGVINLVPLPLLDGGQLLICLLEGLLRRPLPERVLQMGVRLSVFFLIGVMTLALYNDIMRLHN
jgi:regulator of sigma E protease